jgi:predicted  nucleic acid-binding Zn-ribbon protein
MTRFLNRWWKRLVDKLQGSPGGMPHKPTVPSAEYLHERIRDLQFEVAALQAGKRSAEMHASTLTSLLSAKRLQTTALAQQLVDLRKAHVELADSTSARILTLERENERFRGIDGSCAHARQEKTK